MTNIDRKQLKLLTESLGRAWSAINKPIGDTSRNPGALLKLETVLCRLKGSVRFHDFDYAVQHSSLLKYGTLDRVGYGIQGGRVIANNNATQTTFPVYVSGNWNPSFNGPPCPEGWGKWDYNQWKGFPIIEPTNNTPDDGTYSARLTQLTPVRRLSTNVYQQVGFWQNARWISIKNTAGSTSPSRRYKITLTQQELEGILVTDASTDTPLDLRFYSHPNLHQSATEAAQAVTSWSTITQPPTNDDINSLLVAVPFTIERNSVVPTSWDITITRPSYLIDWQNNQWWHIVMYWGSKDTFTNAITIPSPSSDTIIVVPENQQIRWEKKSYFRNELTDRLTWSSLAINDIIDESTSNLHLINRDRTHFQFIDGEYSNPTAPDAYRLSNDWPQATINGFTNSISGYISDIKIGDAIPVLYLTKNQGTEYDNPYSEPYVLVGETCPPENYPSDWSSFSYWPKAPRDYTVIARVVYKKAPGSIYGTVEGSSMSSVQFYQFEKNDNNNLHHNFSILYIDQPATTFAHPPLDDTNLSLTLLSSLTDATKRYRFLNPTIPILNAAYNLIVPGARTPSSLINSRISLANPDGVASQTFRGLLKKPYNSLLKVTTENEPDAFQFSSSARGMIEELSGLPSSTEILRFNSDKLYLTNTVFQTPTKFEIFHEPTDSCTIIDSNGAGVKIGLDYKLRLLLEDASENTLQKDWDIMASKYYLTNQEYEDRVSQGLTTIGYFKKGTDEERAQRAKGTLETINEWRLHGYAGIVPDLSMGEYRVLYNKVVSPEDETRITEEQFRLNLQNQGYSQERIDLAVQDYLEAGGEFYTIDLRQYPNDFVALRSAAISVAEYSFATTPYWKSNINPYFGLEQEGRDEPTPALSSLRADSFTIAPSNLAAGDLENFGTETQLPLDSALDSSSNTGREKMFISSSVGFYFVTTDNSGIGEFSFKAKAVLDVSNTTGLFTNANNDFLKVSLYSNIINENDENVPGELIVTGGKINYNDFQQAYSEFRFNLYSTLNANTKYWIVLEKNAPVEGGVIVFDSGVTMSNGNAAYLWDADFWDTPNSDVWRSGTGWAWIKCYDNISPSSGSILINNSSTTYSGVEEPFLPAKYAIRIASSALGSSIRSFVVRMKFIPDETNQTGLPYNIFDDKIIAMVYSDAGGGVPVTLISTGSFIRINSLLDSWQEFTFAIDELTLGNNYWFVLSKSTEVLGGIIVIDKGDNPKRISKKNNSGVWQSDSGDAWFKFYQSSRFILGAFNRSTFDVLQYLPGPNTSREFGSIYKVDGYWSYTCDKMPTPGPISIYPRAINDGGWSYVRRSKDIYVCVRYEIGGTTYDYFTKLEAAQGWRNLLWKRNSGSYKFVDINETPTLDIITDVVNYTDYDFDGTQSSYFNGRFEGTVKATENGAYQLRLTFNDGVRLYFDGELLIDSWTTEDPIAEQIVTVMTPVLSNASDKYYSIVVEHYYGAANNVSDTQRLRIQWAPPSNLTAYVNLSATSSAPTEVQITPDNIDRIVFLSVGRLENKFDTATHGAPPGDVLVIRSV